MQAGDGTGDAFDVGQDTEHVSGYYDDSFGAERDTEHVEAGPHNQKSSSCLSILCMHYLLYKLEAQELPLQL